MARDRERDLRTGDTLLDEEHRELLAIITALRGMVGSQRRNERVPMLFERLRAEVQAHFAAEERQMEQTRYPMMSSHVAQHTRFLEELELAQDCLRDGDASMTPHLGYIEIWFSRHVEIADKPLADWLNRR